MTSYLTLIAFMIFVMSPVLVPLVITGAHTIGDWRQPRRSGRTSTQSAAPLG